MKALVEAVNEVIAEEYPKQRRKTKGTATFYIMGSLGNKRVCYTKQKTHYKDRFGFWSWVEIKFKNGTTKRHKFALSGTKAKAEKRAGRLMKGLR